MYHIKSAPHKADEQYTVHLREVDADYDRKAGFEVAVTKEGFPPHATEFFDSRGAAEARFAELTGKEEPMKIKVRYAEDSLDDSGTLTEEQLATYPEHLRSRLAELYPDAEIEVSRADDDSVTVYADDYQTVERVGADVQVAVNEHWQSWMDWIAAQL